MFKCIKCAKLFNTIAELNDYFISKHRKLTCKDCDKTFDKPQSYEKHLYIHKSAKHVCDTCGKGFAFKSQLAAQNPIHSGVCMHHCTEGKCSKSFTHAGDLKKHLKTHSKKWWRCEIAGCSYKNRDSRNLKSHMISHSTKKPSSVNTARLNLCGVCNWFVIMKNNNVSMPNVLDHLAIENYQTKPGNIDHE